jgi:hypothetical protein
LSKMKIPRRRNVLDLLALCKMKIPRRRNTLDLLAYSKMKIPRRRNTFDLSIVLGDLAPPSTDGRTDGRTVT